MRGLAKVGLVWSLAVLGFVFTAGAAAASSPSARLAAADAHTFAFVNSGEAPRTAGLVLALVVLGAGLAVLAVGALRTPVAAAGQVEVPRLAGPSEPALTLGLGLPPYSPA